MEYYLKKCGHQELGSVKNGKAQRGRYLLTSMNEKVLSFFPPLSETQLNDSALIPIIPLFSGEKIYCNFVYHNDKFHGSQVAHPRNEYRLYTNKSLEQGKLLFAEGDIIAMRKEEIGLEDDEKQIIYFLDFYHEKESDIYKFLDKIISEYPIQGGYGMYEGKIGEFEEKVESISDLSNTKTVIDESVTKKVIETPDDVLADLFNASTFRDFVMTGYNNLCAITGTAIAYESYLNLEAAHIKPKSHGGLYLPNNGIALCRDLHWAFDKGFFTFDDDLKMRIHPKVNSEYLSKFEGTQLRIPQNPFFVPDLNNVHYHNENVYGLFLTTGRL